MMIEVIRYIENWYYTYDNFSVMKNEHTMYNVHV
jgi:hypothetical protein